MNGDSAQGLKPIEKWDGHNDPANIVQAQTKCRAELAKTESASDRRAMDLCWIEHLVGDIHQPLHAVALFSKQFQHGDRGGNSFAVMRGDAPMNLHSVWDNSLGTGTAPNSLRKQIDGFMAKPELSRKTVQGDKPAAEFAVWVQHSVHLAKRDVYLNGTLKGAVHTGGDYPKDAPALPSGYEEKAKALAAKQVVLAGYRVADVLNAKLGAKAK